ncbi:MAG: hypothetical protein EXS64_00325 [Candidatus Latescibacteria bacterium]|nr:hypothetical protein [Candidatus Latescibacterota bacterium]
MRTVETTATVMADGTLTAQVPPDIPPGEHQVVLVIDEKSLTKKERLSLKFSAYPVGLISEDSTFRREDLYDDGRK